MHYFLLVLVSGPSMPLPSFAISALKRESFSIFTNVLLQIYTFASAFKICSAAPQKTITFVRRCFKWKTFCSKECPKTPTQDVKGGETQEVEALQMLRIVLKKVLDSSSNNSRLHKISVRGDRQCRDLKHQLRDWDLKLTTTSTTAAATMPSLVTFVIALQLFGQEQVLAGRVCRSPGATDSFLIHRQASLPPIRRRLVSLPLT